MSNPLNIAHRGGAQLWPENTLPAFRAAAAAGYDAAELDVQLTRDDRLVIFHDFRLKPGLCCTADGQWLRRRGFGGLPAIRDLTYSQLQQYEVGRARPGSLYARQHPNVVWQEGVRMPLLSEVIAVVRTANPRFRLFIEIKTGLSRRAISAPAEAVADAVLDELQAQDFLTNAVLVGFDWTGLIRAKKWRAETQCWFSTSARSRLGARQIAAEGGDGWFCSLNRANRRAIEKAHECGLRFGVWTVDSVRDMQRLITAGVDGICTDRPDRLARLLENKTAIGPRTRGSRGSVPPTRAGW